MNKFARHDCHIVLRERKSLLYNLPQAAQFAGHRNKSSDLLLTVRKDSYDITVLMFCENVNPSILLYCLVK